MLVSSRGLACAATLLVAAANATAARAQTIAETLDKWGLLGTWAVECSQPPGKNNTHTSYVATSGGSVLRKRLMGSRPDSHQIKSAVVRPDGMIDVVTDYTDLGWGIHKTTLMKGPDGRVKAFASGKADGTEYTIKSGKFVRTGAPAPWQSKCGKGS
jgi:hypothetical protein